jgi:Domain of unknown function(DUF2779)
MTTPRYLTKSRFKLAVECPTKLFYCNKSKIYRDNMAENEFMAMLAEGGYQVGELAKYNFPGGIEIKGKKHDEAESLTKELLKKDEVILFEPAIRVGDFFIRIDVLIKKGDRFELIEVKAKSYDSDNPEIEGKKVFITSDYLSYMQDVAFQKWVLKQAFPKSEIKAFLMMPNKAKKASLDGINQIFKINKDKSVTTTTPAGVDLGILAKELLEKVAVDKYTDHILNTELAYPGGPTMLTDAAIKWAEFYKKDEKIPPVIGAHCGKCQFNSVPGDGLKSGFHECWKQANNWSDKDFENGTVLDLWNSKRKDKYIKNGQLKLTDLTRDDLKEAEEEAGVDGLSQSQRQRLQIEGIPGDYDQGGFYLDRSLVAHHISKWKFPYHMIDFETSAVALPFYKNMRPYESVAFQFSHHVMHENGKIEHAGEFLCVEPGEFPNYKLARELKEQLDKDNGSIFMWSHHENTILSSILRQLENDSNPPSDAEEIKNFIRTIIKEGDRAMIDLCKIAEKAYYHPETKGKSSIKKVLPAILKTSKALIETYSKPIYGAPGGIKSINFSNPKGFAWLTEGKSSDPYALLKQYAKDLMPEGMQDLEEGEASLIAEGGAAATAYSRLQFENLSSDARNRIKDALLRYCETDTLAMVMVLQGWQELIND